MPIYGSSFFVIFQIIDFALFDLLYRLASRREYWEKLSFRGVLLYPLQLPAFLHIPIQEQVKSVPFGVVPDFTLISEASEKKAKM